MTSVAHHVGRQRRRSACRHAGIVVAVAAVAYGLSVRLHAGDPVVNLRLFLVSIGVVALVLLLAIVRWSTEGAGTPGTLLDQLARPVPAEKPTRPADLKRAETSITFALRSASGRDRWFRADVRRLTQARLAEPGRAVRTVDPAVLRQRLTPETWELIRPDRPMDRSHGPGLSAQDVGRILDELEQL